MTNNPTLKSKTAKGIAWSAIGTFSSQGISFVIGVILARILTPSDYGLIGMLAIFFAFSNLIVESGFSNALIQKIDRTESDYSTIFYFNLVVSGFVYLILFFTAPLISTFYNTPELTLLTRILSLNILIGSFAIVQQARLKILLDFKTPALITMISVAISGMFGVVMAYRGFGVWALVAQSLSAVTIRTILLFYFNKWYPKKIFSITSLKQLFGFSSKLLIAGLVATTVNNLYSILIGKLFTPKDVGFYTRARQFPELLSNAVTSILQGVTYPILASLQNERERMVSVYGRLMRVTVFFVIPLLTLFAILAEPFIRFLLTEKWMPIVPLIQWLCFARMITPISALNMNILNAIGRSDLFLKVDLTKVPIALITIAVTVPMGINIVVIGNFFTSFVAFFINAYFPGKLFGFGPFRQIKEMLPVIFATLLMSVIVIALTRIIPGDLFKLIGGVVIGIATYLGAAYLLKIEELKELNAMALQFLVKK
ncbi:lipopolysaccharide biosynthesis protein [Draconibacterium sp.]